MECLLILPCSVIKVNEELQLHPERITNGADLSEMKVWVSKAAQVLDEVKGNAEWRIEEGSYKYQLQPCD